MTETLPPSVTNWEITAGCQLDSLLERHHFYLNHTTFTSDVSGQYPDLVGHEIGLVKALGKAVVERITLMDDMGFGGLAREIVQARRVHHGGRPTD